MKEHQNEKGIQEVDAVLEALNGTKEEAVVAAVASETERRSGKRQRAIRERVTDGAVHAAMVAAILLGVRFGQELPVLIGLGIYHTGASAVAWDRAKR